MIYKIFISILTIMLTISFGQVGKVSFNKARLVPKMLNYQGYLTDTLGSPITDDLFMTFKIFDARSGGNELWSETQSDDVPIESGVFSVILGETTPIPDSVFTDFANTWLELTLDGSQTLTPRTRITSVGYAYTSTYSDTAEYAKNAAADNDWTLSGNVLYPVGSYGLSMRSGNWLYGNNDTTHVCFGVACTTGASGQDYEYCTVSGGWENTASGERATVGGGQYNTASGSYATVAGGEQITASANYATVGGGRYNLVDGEYSAILGGFADTIAVTADYSYLFGINSNLTADSTFMVDMPHIRFGNESNGYEFPAQDGFNGQVMVTDGVGQLSWINGSSFNNWSVTDSVLYTNNYWGIARGGASNALYGDSTHTHVCFGAACTTGMDGQNYFYCTISGGLKNTVSYHYATVGGGKYNTASNWCATVGGGADNTASESRATVAGGSNNTASNVFATVGGGSRNTASQSYATVAGGSVDTAAAFCSFATNYSTKVLSGDDNSAAFTTSHTTAANQVRAANFSTGTMMFTMDHPSDPMNKILNQYAVGSSEAILVYNGTAYIDKNGRVEVVLPDYFEKINRNPMIQLTGVGSSDVVFVAEDVRGNSFVIGGKPGMKVYWTVTAERTDIHAEIARVQTPVEQQKTGDLIGHSLDDDALIGIYDGLQQKKQGHFKFRTEKGRRVNEQSKRLVEK